MSGKSPEVIPFGSRLQQVMEDLRPPRTQSWVAEQSGLQRSTISRIIKGDRNPTLETAACLAPVLGLEVEDLLRGTDAEARLGKVHEVVPRTTYIAVVEKLIEYEARINDLEGKLSSATSALDRESKLRNDAQGNLGIALRDLSKVREDLDEVRERSRRFERGFHDHRKALFEAVGENESLRQQLRDLAAEIDATERTAKVAAILAGVGALTGVISVASLLSEGEEDSGEEWD